MLRLCDPPPLSASSVNYTIFACMQGQNYRGLFVNIASSSECMALSSKPQSQGYLL